MRLVTIQAPEGQGPQVADLAFQAGIAEVSAFHATALRADGQPRMLDVVEFSTATPRAKVFIETLMTAPFYDPLQFRFTVRHPESIFAGEPPELETHPVVRPSTDVYQELWQFTKVTFSLVARVFLAAILLAYGLVEDHLPVIIAGLLFLPYHHHMLGAALGAVLKERRLLQQALLALLLSTVLIGLAGVCVALFLEPPVRFNEFGTPLAGVLLAVVIGTAAGLGSIDDAGRRELIGLAATAHITVYPAWFGLHLIFGFDSSGEWMKHLLSFLLNVSALILAAGVTYALTGMQGDGIRGFVTRIGQRGPSS